MRIIKNLCLVIAIIMLSALATVNFNFVQSSEQTQSRAGIRALPFRDLSAQQIVQEMGAGWNLGNTMDGHTGMMPSETAWQGDITTQRLIDAVHDMGFNTIRVPVTWGQKIDDDNDYKVDEAWMSRVQDIVDYAISQDMYVVVNMHHDGVHDGGGWFNLTLEGDQLEAVKAKYKALWRQIAERFKYYDEHLIFEAMNEVWVTNDNYPYDFEIIGECNQIFVDTVRETGENNKHRWLVCTGRYTNLDAALNPAYKFKLPQDEYNDENRIMVSFHDYDNEFGMDGTVNDFSSQKVNEWKQKFQKMYDNFTSKGIPVLFGEHGAVDNGKNEKGRAHYFEVVYKLSYLSNVVACVWDNNGAYEAGKPAADKFRVIDRKECKPWQKEITDAIMRGYFVRREGQNLKDFSVLSTAGYVYATNSRAASIKEITDITLSDTSLALKPGMAKNVTASLEPSDTNDVLLWKTSDPTVATVYNGLIRAKGIGKATITAFSQSGSVAEQIEVTVYPDRTLKRPATDIATDKELYILEPGETASIDVALTPAKNSEIVRFKSSNPNVATVNKLGKIVGVDDGAAYISITTTSGLTKTVKVVVKTITEDNDLSVGLYVYYNDKENGYYSNELGEATQIVGDGVYTLSFDCDEHLSQDAKTKGVKYLKNLGSIYIKDLKEKPNLLTSGKILYNSIAVDGTDLTITITEPKSAIKNNKVFDTNDPINAWEGSAVSEVTVSDYVLNFTTVTNPKKITVTFTLSDVVFKAGDGSSNNVTKVEIDGKDKVSLDGQKTEEPIAVKITPVDTAEKITFYSSDNSVVYTDISGQDVPSDNGVVNANVVAMGEGEATITAISESGQKAVFNVTVSSLGEISYDGFEEEYINMAEVDDENGETNEKGCKGCKGKNNAVILALMTVLLWSVTRFKK
ncbi:MAG: cellulase family glycosylhydrolase [Clostridiales bacterium]|nr:cellulase family glycosylhydrolase [Clostridiales bacterium]